MGDILGGGSPTNGNSNYEIRGTVESVDPSNQSIWLRNVDGHRTMLSNSGSGNSRGSEVRVYFDNQTTVEYQGRAYRPEDLERGDEVLVRVDESGNRLVATSMSVTHNAAGNTSNSGNGSWPSSGTYNNSVVRGTVRYVDTSRGTIEVDRGGNMASMILDIDTATPVYFNGQTYRVGDLERGDEVEIRVRETGGTRVLAQDITVTRSVQGGGTYGNSSSQRSTVRGTIRQIDTSRRTIELEQTTWMNGFSGGGSSSNRIVVQYSDDTQVDVNGRLHPMNGLERGDIVSVEVSGNGSNYWAERVYLVHDVNNRR
ncbi:MAG TPA: hypothetical protein VF846_21260 [Thermoanaerobaculia bacterium]